MQQDIQLVRNMQNGDEEAMELFVREYYPQILKYCRYHCPDRESAQDLTQETFARFFRNLASYRHRGKILNYLYTIARNLCIDFVRKNRESAPGEYSHQESADSDHGIAGIEERILLHEALEKLIPADMVFLIIELEELVLILRDVDRSVPGEVTVCRRVVSESDFPTVVAHRTGVQPFCRILACHCQCRRNGKHIVRFLDVIVGGKG